MTKNSMLNSSKPIFLKDGKEVSRPRRKYLTWEPDRNVWEEKIKSRPSLYSIRRQEILDKYQPLIEEREKKIRENMKKNQYL